MLEQCCNHSQQRRNNVATLCYAKNRRCESSRVTSPLHVGADVRSDGHVITKISRIYRLPFFLTHGSPLKMMSNTGKPYVIPPDHLKAIIYL